MKLLPLNCIKSNQIIVLVDAKIAQSVYCAGTLHVKQIFHCSQEGILMTIQPLGDRVLVKIEDADQQTAGGIYIPDTAQEKTQNGIVLAIGDDEEIKIKVNDKIIYDKYAGTTVKVNDEEQLILKASDILAVYS